MKHKREQRPDDCYIMYSSYYEKYFCRTPDDQKIAEGDTKTECYLNGLRYCKEHGIKNRIYYGDKESVLKIKQDMERKIKKELGRDLVQMENYY